MLGQLAESKYLRIRAGVGDHRFIWIWAVVADGRVFVRPWNDKRTGWYRVFLEDPRGAILVSDREVRVRARAVRSERLIDAVDLAYAEKYTTPASKKYVRGFKLRQRRLTTTELVPRSSR